MEAEQEEEEAAEDGEAEDGEAEEGEAEDGEAKEEAGEAEEVAVVNRRTLTLIYIISINICNFCIAHLSVKLKLLIVTSCDLGQMQVREVGIMHTECRMSHDAIGHWQQYRNGEEEE